MNRSHRLSAVLAAASVLTAACGGDGRPAGQPAGSSEPARPPGSAASSPPGSPPGGAAPASPTAKPAPGPIVVRDETVAEVAAPTALAATPDGRILVASQPGHLRVVVGGRLLARPALDLRARVCGDFERGLLGVAVDPDFDANHFIYLYYTFKADGGCARNSPSSPVNRVARFTLGGDNTVAPSSERVLIDNMPSPNGNHNGGDVKFGPDGLLYVSIGDGGCDYAGDSGCAGSNDASRDRNVLTGKVLRITRDGAVPPSNPFVGRGTARCNVTGRTEVGRTCQEAFAVGLRNPFRIAFDPTAPGARFYVNDVGQNAWEEIDEGRAGADYGWNVREGGCAAGSTRSCGRPPEGMTNPVFAYGRQDGCATVSGGAFVPAGAWPPGYEGAYLFGDFACGRLFRLAPRRGGGFDRVEVARTPGIVATAFLSVNGSTALYYTSYASGGGLHRLTVTPR